ncbi:MAG: DUF2306 domain-containing protein [Gammaproteobacteria bacterium]|nr:DUF2306 domain-containing protein [Gammaproteobacteria bacterium]
MAYEQLAWIHLALIAPAPFLGGYLLLRKKGTPKHRQLGKIYMLLMFSSALISLFMPAHIGPQFVWHWGWIHGLSFWTLISIVMALYFVKRGNIIAHRKLCIKQPV